MAYSAPLKTVRAGRREVTMRVPACLAPLLLAGVPLEQLLRVVLPMVRRSGLTRGCQSG